MRHEKKVFEMSAPIDTRLKLMQTASSLIGESNYDNVGIVEICKQAGVTKGAFYHHFQSKADLFVHANAYEWASIQADLDQIFSPRFTALEQLQGMLSLAVSRQCKLGEEVHICGMPSFSSAGQSGCEELQVRKSIVDLSTKSSVYFSALARNLQAEGYLNADIDAVQTGRVLQQFMQGLLEYGRVFQNFEQFCADLRAGFYQVLGLKQEYRCFDCMRSKVVECMPERV